MMKNRKSLDIQGDGMNACATILRHCTQTDVNDSATCARSDTPLTRFCSYPVLSQGEAA